MSTRTILSQKLRPFKIDIYGLQDNYLGVLQSYNDNSLGQVIEPKIQVSKDGSQSFSCSIPKYIIDVTTNQKKLNPRWGDFENGVLAENTRVLKAFVNFENETKVFPFIIDKIEDKRDAHYSVFKKIEGTGLAFAELGKLGYKLELNESLVNREQKDDPKLLTTIQYWLDKVFPNEKDENGNIIRWLTPWCYEIRMDWSYHSDIDKAINASSFDTLDNTFLLNLSKLYSQSPRESDKIYDSGYISSWNVDENDNLLAAGYTPPQEKCRIIDCVNSNKYNITQTLAETYEVFCEYEYKCANNGTFVKEYIDDNGKIWMGRKVIFYNDGIKLDNPLYIDYQKNLQSITRTSDSSELFTKLYITPSQSESMDTGYITIADTLANPILDDFILNFDYLYSVGSISNFQKDFIKTYEAALRRINLNLMETAPELDDIIVEINELTAEKEMLEKQITSAQEELSDYETLRDNDVYQKKIIKDKTNAHSVVFTEDGQFYKASLRLDGINKGTIKGYSNISYEDSALIFEGETMATIKAPTDIPAISEESEEKYYVLTDDYNYPAAIYCNKAPSHTIVYLSLEYCPKNKYTDICESFNNKINNCVQRKENVSALLISLEETKTNLQKSYDSKLEEKELLNQKLEKVLGAALREGYWTPDQYQDSRQSIERKFDKETLMFDTELFDSETPSYTAVGENTIYYPYYKINEQLLTAFKTHSPEDLIIHLQRDFEGTVQETTTLASGNYYFLYNRQKYYFTLKEELIKDDKLIIKVNGDKLTLLQLHNNKETTIELEDANNNGTNLTSFFEGIGQFLGDYLLYNQAGFIYSFKKEANKIVPILLFNNDNYLSNYSKYYKIGYSFQNETKVTLLDDGYLKNVPVYTNGNLLANTPYEICYPRMALPENNIQYNSENLKITLTNGVESVELKKYYDYSILLRESKVYITLKFTENNSIHKLLDNNYYYNIIYEVSRANEVLFLDAKTVAKDNSMPRFSYDLSVASVPKITDEKITSIELGQLAYISDPILGVNAATGYVSEITFVLDEPQKDEVKIQNYKTKFEDLFSTITASSEAMKVNQASYDLAASGFLSNGSIASAVFQDTLNNNDFFFNYSTTGVDIDPVNGITLTNKKPYANGVYGQMVLQGDGIYLSSSINEATGERIWNTGITPQGISASALVAGSLDTSLIKIYSGENLAFQWNGEGLFAYKRDESGLPSMDSYVKYSDQGLHFIVNEADHSDNCQVSLGWDGLKLSAQSGALTLTAQDGLQIFYPEEMGAEKPALQVGRWSETNVGPGNSIINYYGMRLCDTQGNETFTVDNNGNLMITGTMQSKRFASGILGYGWQIRNDGTAEFQDVHVRGTISASVFEYQETTAVGGELYIGPTLIIDYNRAKEAKFSYNAKDNQLVLEADLGFTGSGNTELCGRVWQINDILGINCCLVNDAGDKYEIKNLHMCLTTINNTAGKPDKLVSSVLWETSLNVFYDKNGNPVQLKDIDWKGLKASGPINCIFIGSEDDTTHNRKGILLTAMADDSPYMDIYDDAAVRNELKGAPKVRIGNLAGLGELSWDGYTMKPEGYGLYSDNVYLTGAIYATSGKIGSLSINEVENGVASLDVRLESSSGLAFKEGTTITTTLQSTIRTARGEQLGSLAKFAEKGMTDVNIKFQKNVGNGWTNLTQGEWSGGQYIVTGIAMDITTKYRVYLSYNNHSLNNEVYSNEISFTTSGTRIVGEPQIKYAVSSNGTTPPTNENDWSTSIKITVTGQFLWTRTIITYSDGSQSVSYSVAAHGATGDSAINYTLVTNVRTIARDLQPPLSTNILTITVNKTIGTVESVVQNLTSESLSAVCENMVTESNGSISLSTINSSIISTTNNQITIKLNDGTYGYQKGITTHVPNDTGNQQTIAAAGKYANITGIKITLKQNNFIVDTLTIPFTIGDNLTDMGMIQDGKVVIDGGLLAANTVAAETIKAYSITTRELQVGTITAGFNSEHQGKIAFSDTGLILTGGTISLDGKSSINIATGGTFTLDSNNFTINADGSVEIKGHIEATSGKIGSLTIGQVENEYSAIDFKLCSTTNFIYNPDTEIDISLFLEMYRGRVKVDEMPNDLNIDYIYCEYSDQSRKPFASGRITNSSPSISQSKVSLKGHYPQKDAATYYATITVYFKDGTNKKFNLSEIFIPTAKGDTGSTGPEGPKGPEGAPALMYRLARDANEVVRDLTGITPEELNFTIIANEGGIDRIITDPEEFKNFILNITGTYYSGTRPTILIIPEANIRDDDKCCWKLSTSNLSPKVKQWTCTLTGLSTKETTTFSVVPGDSINELAQIKNGQVYIKDGSIYAESLAAYAVTTEKIATDAITANKIKAGEISVEKVNSSFGKDLDISSNTNIGLYVNENGITTSSIILNSEGITIKTGGIFKIEDSTNFKIDEFGNVSLTGTVTAENGFIGGWKIGETSLHSGSGNNYVALSSDSDSIYRIWAGNSDPSSAAFAVTKDGSVYLGKVYVQTGANEDGEPIYSTRSLTDYPLWAIWSAYNGNPTSMNYTNGTLTITTRGGTSLTANFNIAVGVGTDGNANIFAVDSNGKQVGTSKSATLAVDGTLNYTAGKTTALVYTNILLGGAVVRNDFTSVNVEPILNSVTVDTAEVDGTVTFTDTNYAQIPITIITTNKLTHMTTLAVNCTKIYNNGKTDGADSLVFYAGGEENVAELDYGESLSITATTTKGDGTSNAKGILVKAPADRYEAGRKKGWEEAASKFYRDGNYVYGPGDSLGTNTYYKATAKLTGHTYTESSASPGPYQGTYIDYNKSTHTDGTLSVSWNK